MKTLKLENVPSGGFFWPEFKVQMKYSFFGNATYELTLVAFEKISALLLAETIYPEAEVLICNGVKLENGEFYSEESGELIKIFSVERIENEGQASILGMNLSYAEAKNLLVSIEDHYDYQILHKGL